MLQAMHTTFYLHFILSFKVHVRMSLVCSFFPAFFLFFSTFSVCIALSVPYSVQSSYTRCVRTYMEKLSLNIFRLCNPKLTFNQTVSSLRHQNLNIHFSYLSILSLPFFTSTSLFVRLQLWILSLSSLPLSYQNSHCFIIAAQRFVTIDCEHRLFDWRVNLHSKIQHWY